MQKFSCSTKEASFTKGCWPGAQTLNCNCSGSFMLKSWSCHKQIGKVTNTYNIKVGSVANGKSGEEEVDKINRPGSFEQCIVTFKSNCVWLRTITLNWKMFISVNKSNKSR